MPRYERRAGDVVHGWVLQKPLGVGGNAEVWKALNDTGVEVALKILKRRDPEAEAYRRFRSEVEVHRAISGVPGVLPLIDAHLPDHPSRKSPAWLATPIGVPLKPSLGDNPTLESVVEAVAEVADTLARLHADRIHHRDVKPENMFTYQGGSVVGDFGLVSFPEKEAITEQGRKLGPLWYLAPEMLARPQDADGGPADVYSIGKSLWVLTTGQTFPPPGEHRFDTPGMRISDYASHPRIAFLDRLVERATYYNPSERPRMHEVAEELRAWLADERPTSPPDDLGDIEARIKPLTSIAVRTAEAREGAQRGVNDIYNRLLESIRPLEERVRSVGSPAKLQTCDVFLKGY